MVDSISQMQQDMLGAREALERSNMDSEILAQFRGHIEKANTNSGRLPDIASTEQYSRNRAIELAAKGLLEAEKSMNMQAKIAGRAAQNPAVTQQDLDAGQLNPVVEAQILDLMRGEYGRSLEAMPEAVTDKLAALKAQEVVR